MKQYDTPRHQEISLIVVSCVERWAKEFMSDVLISKEGIIDDTAVKEVVTESDGTYDDSCRLEFLNDCEEKVFGFVGETDLDSITTVGELIDKFIEMDKDPQIAQLVKRAETQIELGKATGSHTGRSTNIYQIAEELLALVKNKVNN